VLKKISWEIILCASGGFFGMFVSWVNVVLSLGQGPPSPQPCRRRREQKRREYS